MKRNSTIVSFDIEHIAKLARLTLTDEEKKTFTPQLEEVLAYFQKLNEIDTEGVEPTFHVIKGLQNRFQEQKIASDTLAQEDVLKNVKEKKDGYVLTEKVI
jgi:aspartyl-tRNA(Asn)/glutamyl-tRNA(Gln) amidotransferase subunit C